MRNDLPKKRSVCYAAPHPHGRNVHFFRQTKIEGTFAQAQQSADDTMTDGLAVYSRRADDAEYSVAG